MAIIGKSGAVSLAIFEDEEKTDAACSIDAKIYIQFAGNGTPGRPNAARSMSICFFTGLGNMLSFAPASRDL